MFATIKFHYRFNIDRKFHDLENVDKNKAIKVSSIDKSFKNLKWISKLDEPANETQVIKKALATIQQDNVEKV